MQFAAIKARDTIERLAAAGDPYAVTRADLVAAVRLIPRDELARRFYHDALLTNFVLNHLEYAQGAATLTTYPWNVVIPIADICNARCVFCNSWLRGKRLLELSELEKFAPVLKTAAMISLEGHGEPLFHPKFGEIARTLRQTIDPRCRISIITNALLLDERLDELLGMGVNVFNVSLNAATAATHETVMGLGVEAFDRVVATLRELQRRGAAMDVARKPAVNLSMAVTAMNIHEIPQFITLAESLGASQVNLRTLLPQTELLAGLNYHVLPPYLAPEFAQHLAAARSAIAATRLSVDADLSSWSKPIFPEAVQQRIDAQAPAMVHRRDAQRVVVLQKSDYKGLEKMRSNGELLLAGEGDPRWTMREEAAPDTADRLAPFKCSDVYTTLHMNDFFFVLRPCCYMDAVPNHDVIKYDGGDNFLEAWNSPAMVSLRQRLHAGPLYNMCRRCPKQPQYQAPVPRIGDYETAPAALGQWETHQWASEAVDHGVSGTLVVTPAEQWAYAALMPLRLTTPGIGGRFAVELTVEDGSVGVGLLHAGGEALVAEFARDARSASGPVSFRVSDLSTVKGILLRNRAAGGKRSRVLVHSAELQLRRDFGELMGYRVKRRILALGDLAPTDKVISANWIERDADYELVPGAKGAWQADASWGADLVDHGRQGVTITTSSQQWAYAAMMELRSPGVGISVRLGIDLKVLEGAVRVGVLDADGTAFLAEEQRDPQSAERSIYFRFGDLSKVKCLIVRNASDAGVRSMVLVRSVTVQVLRAPGSIEDPLLVGLDGRIVGSAGSTLHDGVTVGGAGEFEGGLQLVSGPLPWASLAIARLGDATVGLAGPAVFTVRLRVMQGQILVGLLDRSGDNMLAQTFWGVTPQAADIVLHCSALEDVSAIVVRASNLVEPAPVVLVSGLSVAQAPSLSLH